MHAVKTGINFSIAVIMVIWTNRIRHCCRQRTGSLGITSMRSGRSVSTLNRYFSDFSRPLEEVHSRAGRRQLHLSNMFGCPYPKARMDRNDSRTAEPAAPGIAPTPLGLRCIAENHGRLVGPPTSGGQCEIANGESYGRGRRRSGDRNGHAGVCSGSYGAMDLAACTPVPCGHAANDPGVREQRILQRKRLLNRRLRRDGAVAAPRNTCRRGRAWCSAREHGCERSCPRNNGNIRADGRIPPDRTTLVPAPDRRRPGASRRRSRRRLDGVRTRMVRSRSRASLFGILKPAQHSVLPTLRLRTARRDPGRFVSDARPDAAAIALSFSSIRWFVAYGHRARHSRETKMEWTSLTVYRRGA